MRARLIAPLVGALACLTPALAQFEHPVYLDRAGRPVPIQSDAEIIDFLTTARETASEPLSKGITQAFRLELTKGDLTLRAVFHHVNRNEHKRKRLPNDKMVAYLRDSYLSQVAAYRLGRMLGIQNIPPTVLRRSQNKEGSAQLWIEKAKMEQERQEAGEAPPDVTLWNQLYADMRVFDNLINNIDRNTGNMLVDSHGFLWLIDHTRSFGRDKGLPRPETVTRCSRGLYQAIRDLDHAEVQLVMRPPTSPKRHALLTNDEIEALFKRREKLLELLDARIAQEGERLVLFNYGDPDPGITVDEGDG